MAANTNIFHILTPNMQIFSKFEKMKMYSINSNYRNSIKQFAYITIYNHIYDSDSIYNIFKNQNGGQH